MSFKAGVEAKGRESEQDNSIKARSARFASFMDEALGLLAAEFSYQGAECLERVFDLAFEAHSEVVAGQGDLERTHLEAMKSPDRHGVGVACDYIAAKLADVGDLFEILTITHKLSLGGFDNTDPVEHRLTQERLAAAGAVLDRIRKDVLALAEPHSAAEPTEVTGDAFGF